MTEIVNPEWATEIEPTYVGLAGRAWLCEYSMPSTASEADLATNESTLRQYLLHVPGAHPFWTWYFMAGITLRDVPGLSPANKQFEGATHELMVLSLDPGYPPPLPNGEYGKQGQLRPLMPPDHVVQTMHVNDEQFGEMTELFVRAVVDGKLSPDSDHREKWRSTMMSTTDHYRGLHDRG